MVKNRWLFSMLIGVFVMMAACAPADDSTWTPEVVERPSTTETEEEHDPDDESENMENKTLQITVQGRSFTATLVENSSTAALVERLSAGDIDIRMEDYGDMEKVGTLSFSLPRNDEQMATSPGDLILYQGNSLVIYYDTNAWRLTRLGKVDGVTSREQMLALLGGKGAVTVTLSLKE